MLRRAGKVLAFFVPSAAVVVDCVGYAAQVEGISMQPLLNPEGGQDFVLLDRTVTFDYDKIKRGDVVALNSPRNPNEKLIKRVIALQGDSVITRKGNKVVQIPPGHMWVEGDNQKRSYDSNDFGAISLGVTVARASYIIWPPERFGAIESVVSPDRAPTHGHLCQQCVPEEDEASVSEELCDMLA